MTATVRDAFSRVFPFWSSLPETEQETLVRAGRSLFFKAGSIIHDGTDCTGLFLVQRGSLRVYMTSEEGREITLYRLCEGDVCMLSASCVLQTITFDVQVCAEEDSDVILLSPGSFASASERYPEVKIFGLELAVERFSEVMWVFQQILFMSTDRRLAIFLFEETSKRGSDTLSMTHEQIARYIGSAREVVSRMLKYFSAEGIVTLFRGGVTVTNRAALRRLALE